MASEWRFPGDVDGWLSRAEGEMLRELAAGKVVVEVGSYCGRSTICLAQAAERVYSIDPHDGRGTPRPRNTFPDFRSNLLRYKVRHRVKALVGTLAEKAGDVPEQAGLLFIDGGHAAGQVLDDARRCLPLLAGGGLLAFHDFGRPRDPGVTAAVRQILAGGGRMVRSLDAGGDEGDHLAVIDPSGWRPAPADDRPLVALATPSARSWVSDGAARGIYMRPTLGACRVRIIPVKGSQLCKNFNIAWAQALAGRATDGWSLFAMCHDDVQPQAGWLDLLWEEMRRLDADVVSAVIPFRTPDGLTSTAVGTEDQWQSRRLTLTEVWEQLPETFSTADVAPRWGPGPLLVNTGLWLARLDRPWCDREENGELAMRFEMRERILARPGGRYHVQSQSEDWLFSRYLHEAGARYFATRKVGLDHLGEMLYSNREPWGEYASDPLFAEEGEAVGA